MYKLAFILLCAIPIILADYWSDREDFKNAEESMMIGGQIQLTEKERAANQIIMTYKNAEIGDGYKNPSNFLPAQHFFHARKNIEKSKVYKILQQLPKGAMLHGHDTALASTEFVLTLTYRDNLYGCKVNDRLQMRFFEEPISDTTCEWRSMKNWRDDTPNFDDWVRSQLTMDVSNPKEVYTDKNIVWKAFEKIFGTVEPLISYAPIFKDYFYQVLQELYDDNVMYLEFRGYLPPVYDLVGTKYKPIDIVRLYKETLDTFMANHSRFYGAKFIYAPSRKSNKTIVANYIQDAIALKKEFPDFVAGFDLVGQEDIGRPLKEFADELVLHDLKYFFHAGETNWYGSTTDMNLVDAVLLNTTRIGHAYALSKHPKVLEYVKANGIGIEVSPISNQVLLLVDDLRNHPASTYIANDLPVVICYDDPSFWGVKGLSYDWYETFMGIASNRADIKVLKQLALNSLKYSSLNEFQKIDALRTWNMEWDMFLDNILNASAEISTSPVHQ